MCVLTCGVYAGVYTYALCVCMFVCAVPVAAVLKVTGYNFNFARAIINLYTKHWAVSAENFGVSFRGAKTLCDRIYGLF